jgi:hypothetical protein
LVAFFMLAILLPAAQSAREAARRMQCASHLQQVGLAIADYSTSNRYLPPFR